MKIVHIAPIEEAVPPKKYGGIERVVKDTIEAQVQAGHDVHLIGSSDSQISGNLHGFVTALRNKYTSDRKLKVARVYYKYRYPFFVLAKINDLNPDIVHNHYAWRILAAGKLIKTPMVSTMHGPLTSASAKRTYLDHKQENYISISNNQRKSLPQLNWIATVYNGVDTAKYQPTPNPSRDYLAFLGRISPEKGVHEIVKVIAKTGHRLKIAAKIDPVDRKYYETKVKPYIDGKRIEYIGELDDSQKVTFLQNARALLLWLNWEEPFGLVVVEAMACGTPVIVNPRGSMPEIVSPGKTGYFIKTPESLPQAISKLDQINPHDCTTWVHQRFSTQVMAADYLRVYRQVILRQAKRYKKNLSPIPPIDLALQPNT